MEQAIGETNRRRAKQLAYNQEHNITPQSIVKAIDASLVEMYSPEWAVVPEVGNGKKEEEEFIPAHELPDRITELRQQMMDAAEKLDYEHAAELRDKIKKLERHAFGMDQPRRPETPSGPPGSAHQRPSIEKGIAAKTRGRRGAAAATGAAAGAMQSDRPVKQSKLKLIPDNPK
jgi:excinuclease ABC subunit B